MLVWLLLAQLQLPDVLRTLGDDAEKREAAPPCTYHETTMVEDLAEDGTVKGAETRDYEAELKGVEVVKRERISVKPSGAPLSDLLVEPKNAKGRKPARSPFVPALRPQFRFALKDGPKPELMTVTLEPLKPDVERPRGEAWVRKSDGRIVELRVSPSKVPMLLDAMSLRLVFDDTACGRVATEVFIEGKGDSMIIETSFRSHTVLSGHQLKKTPR